MKKRTAAGTEYSVDTSRLSCRSHPSLGESQASLPRPEGLPDLDHRYKVLEAVRKHNAELLSLGVDEYLARRFQKSVTNNPPDL
jgi:hypothetical protein